jgi:hypothetical protein
VLQVGAWVAIAAYLLLLLRARRRAEVRVDVS